MDPVKIYALCILTLITVLIFLTWHLFSEKRRLHGIGVKKYTGVYIFILFFMIIFMLLIMIHLYEGPKIILANSEGYKISLTEKVEHLNYDQVALLDPTVYHVDEHKSFVVTLPLDSQWSKPIAMNGLRAYVERAGLETNQTNVESFLKWNPYREFLSCIFVDLTMKPYIDMVACLDYTLVNSTYGKMLRKSRSTLIQYGKPIKIQVNVQSGTPFNVMGAGPDALGKADSSDVADQDAKATLSYSNYFSLTILDKTAMEADNNKLTLANYFLKNTINLTSNAERIIASENNMLFTSSFEFKGAEMEGKTIDLRIQRWVRMLEEQDKLYILELAYSPDTDPGKLIWKDLKLIFESFIILAE
ncbi:MAG: hypothetical protein COB85_03450 [Bacteroidetes bacterium]|nr:MAG: hypothetical protein COB85_03450 [Bacteroidota bacterium]